MNRMIAIFNKEVKSYFLSPIAYVVMTGFVVLSGLSFYYRAVYYVKMVKSAYDRGELEVIKGNWINHFMIAPMIEDMTYIMIFLMPVLTMRLFSEEKRSRTDELLLTSPVTVNQIVVAKYLAGLFFAMLLVLSSLIYVAILYYYQSGPDPGTTFTSYLSVTLFVSSMVAIGIFTSSLTENQIIASVLCLIIELLFLTFSVVSRSVSTPFLQKVIGYLSITSHMRNFMDGVIISEDIIYFLSFTFLFLFLTNRSVESSRWR